MAELFSFKGEIGRGRVWLIFIGLGIAGSVIQFALIAASRFAGDPPLMSDGDFGLPSSAVGWSINATDWFTACVMAWIFAAAFVKRLREVGIALKWLAIFVALAIVTSLAMSRLVHDGDVHIPPLAWFVIFFMGFPTAGIGFWVFGSVFLAPSGKQRVFDPSGLPDGWKK
jgi:uncharacterized membrane protein YhaH (DUF805 family)